MVQFQINTNGIFVILIVCVTLLLFWWSESGSHFTPSSNVLGLQGLLSQSIIAAELGGIAIQSTMRSGSNLTFTKKYLLVNHKPEVVSDADLVSHLCISNKFAELSSEIMVRSEEHELPSGKVQENIVDLCSAPLKEHIINELPKRDVFLRDNQIVVWVDPLDATQELSEGLLDYISVMVCSAVQGNPVFGVLHFVFSNTTYWAWFPHDMSPNMPPPPTSIPSTVVRILVSRSHGLKNLNEHIETVFAPTKVKVIPAGGTGYKIMQLIKGEADLYIHPSGARRWDLCAAEVILETSGGMLTTMTGKRFTFAKNDPDTIISQEGIFAAASKSLHDEWLSHVKRVHSIFANDSS